MRDGWRGGGGDIQRSKPGTDHRTRVSPNESIMAQSRYAYTTAMYRAGKANAVTRATQGTAVLAYMHSERVKSPVIVRKMRRRGVNRAIWPLVSPARFRRADVTRLLRDYVEQCAKWCAARTCPECMSTRCRRVAPHVNLPDLTCRPMMMRVWERLVKRNVSQFWELLLRCGLYLCCERCACVACHEHGGSAFVVANSRYDDDDDDDRDDKELGKQIYKMLSIWHAASIGLIVSRLFERNRIDPNVHAEEIRSVFNALLSSGNVHLAFPLSFYVTRPYVLAAVRGFVDAHDERTYDFGDPNYLKNWTKKSKIHRECLCHGLWKNHTALIALNIMCAAREIELADCLAACAESEMGCVRIETENILRRCFGDVGETYGQLAAAALRAIFTHYGAHGLDGVGVRLPPGQRDVAARCVKELTSMCFVDNLLTNYKSPITYDGFDATVCCPPCSMLELFYKPNERQRRRW